MADVGAGGADGQSVRLADDVRQRVLALASFALGGLAEDEVPRTLRPFVRFTPSRRARVAGAALAAALEGDGTFRARVAALLAADDPLAASVLSGTVPPAAEPVQVAAHASSMAEIAVALADVRCKKWTNLTGIRMAIDSAYQRAAILAHARGLHSLRALQQRQVRTAVQVLAIR